jgi:hypothetical protein
MFPFPALKAGITPASIEYKHYQDADLVTVDAAKAAAGVKLTSRIGNGPRNLTRLGLAGLVIAALVLFLRRKRGGSQVAIKDLTAPADPTPFSTVAFLRRIRSDHAPNLSDKDKAALNAQIDEIETGYFSGGEAPSMDLPAVIHRWLGVVRKA